MTEVAHLLHTSINIDEPDESKPFHIINQDNLPMTIIGERMFKPFGSENQKRKPNGIVYPTRRFDLSNQQVNQQKYLTKSNGHLDVPQKILKDGSNYKKLSISHGQLNQMKSKQQDDFAKNLDAKLRRLQNDKRKVDDHSKKPFITTVTKGKFLEAPEKSPRAARSAKKEEECIKQEKDQKKQLYAFVSKPMVLSRSPPQNVHRSTCEAAAIAAGLPCIHNTEDPTNEVSKQRRKREAIVPEIHTPERRILKERDQNFVHIQQKNEPPKWNPYFAYARLLSQEDIQARETRVEMTRRRALARKKARMQSDRRSQVLNGMERPVKNVECIGVEVQTDNYLEASLVKPPMINMVAQTETDFIQEQQCGSSLTERTCDEETQISPGDLFDLEEEIQPALEILVGKTIESALIEILEEEELATLKEQQRKFMEIREEEQKQTEELYEKHLVEQIHRRNAKGVSLLFESQLVRLIPPVLDELKTESDLIGDEISNNGIFLRWLMEEVTMELGDILSSGDVLIEIIRDILNRRKEINRAMSTEAEREYSPEKTIAKTNGQLEVC